MSFSAISHGQFLLQGIHNKIKQLENDNKALKRMFHGYAFLGYLVVALLESTYINFLGWPGCVFLWTDLNEQLKEVAEECMEAGKI